MSEPFWFQEPSVLFSKDTWYQFVPQPHMPVKTALNAVVRFSVYLTALLLITTRDPMYILFVPVVMLITIFLEKWFPKAKKISEGFQSGPVVSGYRGKDVSMPTEDNPFMNPGLTDIMDDPERPPAAEITDVSVRDKVNAAFTKTSNIYMDTTDVFDMVQSQRNFYSVPSDDYGGFLQFLGKNGQATNQKGLSEGFVLSKGTVSSTDLPTSGPRPYTAPASSA
jgi:hypothetical protein